MKNTPTSLFRGLAGVLLSASLTAGCSRTVPPLVKTPEPVVTPVAPTLSPPPSSAEALQSPVTAATPKPVYKSTPKATSRPRASRTATVTTTRSLRGNATWYHYVVGGAAAGPNLRRAIGKHWRGRIVTVCRRSCVRVKLSDWCLCRRGNRLVDLDHRSFDALGSLSEGVIPVIVKW